MLGQAIMNVLSGSSHTVHGCDKSTCDITQIESLRALVAETKPTHIINCAAYTAVDLAESEQDMCWQLNVLGVQNIVSVAREHTAKVVQLSTDYVFAGNQNSYVETALVQPINYYGLTKAVGEQLVATLPEYAIVRTAWLYGAGGKNFIDTIAQRLQAGESLQVVDDQFGSPTWTNDLAEQIILVLEAPSGVYHCTNSDSCSWYELAGVVATTLGYEATAVARCSSSEYPRAASRPVYSVLQNTKLPSLRPWSEAVKAYLATKQS